jgi:hypothetical protein
VVARCFVRDGGLTRSTGYVAHEHGSRFGYGLHARRGVDQVAGDHALALRSNRHRGLAGQYSRTRLQGGVQLGNGGDEAEGCPHRPLGVVLLCHRSAPDRHDRVADELLDGSAVALDERPGLLEVSRQKLSCLLGIAILGRGREADEVGEEDRDEAALGGARRWLVRVTRRSGGRGG